nr:MAG: transposase [Leptolyngbya sp. IPPAS B-1204]
MNFTYRVYPSAIQQAKLLEWLETCRGVYNYALRELKDWIASRKCQVDRCSLEKEYIIPAAEPFPSYHRQQNNLPNAKKEFPHLGQVHSQVLQTTIRRLHDTWEAFQKRGFGFPRFKKYGQFKSIVFPQFKDNPIRSRGTGFANNGFELNLPKLGEMPIRMSRPIPDGFQVKQVRVLSKARGTQWYVVISIQSDVSVPCVPAHGRSIGIDLGLERFATLSDGSFIERPKFLKSQHRKLKLLQRRAARKQNRSANWEKAQVKVARQYHHIANKRKDFHYKTAHQICDQGQTIFVEDLNGVGLNRGMRRKECVDAAFGQFLSIQEWVCWKRGAFFMRVNPNGTSQTCPHCGATVHKSLDGREHHCPECNYRTHRDHAAAQVVELRGLDNLVLVDISAERRLRQRGTERVCAGVLAGSEMASQVPKARKGVTRKAKS